MSLPSSEQAPAFDVQASSSIASEHLIKYLLTVAGMIPLGVIGGIIALFIYQSWLFFQEIPLWKFLTETQWTPQFTSQKFGILVLITATLQVSVIAMLVAIPIGLLAAVYLSECAPKSIRSILRPLLDSLSGVPTIVYGYFAVLLVTPSLKLLIPNLSVFNGLSAGLMTGLLITPIISAFSEDALSNVEKSQRRAAYACGLTQFELIWQVLLPAALPGIIASFTLAASRALGETMIAAIAAGQNPRLTLNPLVPIETMTGFIVQMSLGEVATDSLIFHTIFAVGAVLFLITLVLNSIGNWLVHKYTRTVENQGRPVADTTVDSVIYEISDVPALDDFVPALFKRQFLNQAFTFLGLLASLVGPGFLALLTLVTLRLGLSQLNWHFFTNLTSSNPEQAGILAAILGTLWLLVLTTLFAVPIGIAAAIYLEEYVPDSTWSRFLEANLANATAVPGILYGLLGIVVFAKGLEKITGGRSLIAAAMMMALLVLPLLITASRSALRSVPSTLKQGGYAVGMSQWQVIWYVVLPAARPGLLTALLLTASRVIGEASPLIALGAVPFVTFVPGFSLDGLQSPFTTLTTQIFFWLSSPQPVFQEKAAAAVIVLGMMVLFMNGIAAFIRDRIQKAS